MSCVNKVILLGPCFNIKPITTNSGKEMVSFNLKTWVKSGETERKCYHNCVAYSGAATVLINNLQDGEFLYVEGRIDQFKDSHDNYRSQVIIEEFKFVTNRP
jgi:single-stranded DNA-binding protein